MASIEKRVGRTGEISYHLAIRKKGVEIYKTFQDLEDAKLYEFYKERLIDNMANFEVPLSQRLPIHSIFDMKIKDYEDRRQIGDMLNCKMRVLEYFKEKVFFHQISYEEWLAFAKHLFSTDVYRGGKTEKSKRKMSPVTLKKIFALISSAISFAQSKQIDIENHASKVLTCYIWPLIKETSKNDE